MTRYVVKVRVEGYARFVVDADNPAAAEDIALTRFESGEDGDMGYVDAIDASAEEDS